MSRTQRHLLEQFFVDEKGHAEHIYECFSEVGLDPAEVRVALASVETELFERFIYSCAARSPLVFAAALIIPEIPEVAPHSRTPDSRVLDLVGMAEEVQELPKSVCDCFRAHDHDNLTLGHESLPAQLISDRVVLSRHEADELFVTVHYAMHAYRTLLDGVVRRYHTAGAEEPLLRHLRDITS